MNWTKLSDTTQLEAIKQESISQKVVIFKHSTSCSISRTVLDRLERNWKDEEMKSVKPYYLDLLAYRSISNKIAEDFNIVHESPQVIVIANGRPVYSTSHFDINYQKLRELA
jgi:bacillithiol system protein YtxJ